MICFTLFDITNEMICFFSKSFNTSLCLILFLSLISKQNILFRFQSGTIPLLTMHNIKVSLRFERSMQKKPMQATYDDDAKKNKINAKRIDNHSDYEIYI